VVAGKDVEVADTAQRLAADLAAAGVDVLLDDRPGSAGVKFADAELLGLPTIVVVGRGVRDGVVEVRDRRTGQRQPVPVEAAAATLRGLVRPAPTGPG
jgi:prolyl-tRNA synthetase